MKNSEFIRNKEYYQTSFNKILNILNKYNKDINRLCCGYCLECKYIDTVKNHKCKYMI